MSALFFDPVKRDEVMKEANLYIIEKVYYIVLPVGRTWKYWWPWVKGYSGEGGIGVCDGHVYKYVWLDDELRKSMGY